MPVRGVDSGDPKALGPRVDFGGGWLEIETGVSAMKIFECISVLRALGEENRLRLVKLLLAQPMGVNELAEASDQSQYNVSKHLRTLREAGLVEVAKEGQKRLYSVSRELHTHLKRNRNTLDLGCCTFDFEEASKVS